MTVSLIRGQMEAVVIEELTRAPEFDFAFEITHDQCSSDPKDHSGWDTVLCLQAETMVEDDKMVLSSFPSVHYYPPAEAQLRSLVREAILSMRGQVLERLAMHADETG